MSKAGSAVGNKEMVRKDLPCPRDKTVMAEQLVGEAHLDVCRKCGGQFFDAGEMFASFGIKADPSSWDRKETGGSVKDSELHCPRCDSFMLAQDVAYDDAAVEIDRCGHCGGLWLDKGEVEKIMAVAERLAPVLDAEKAKAQAELAALGDVKFSAGLIGSFLNMFRH